MKILCLTTGKEVNIGDGLRCVSGILNGHLIKVSSIMEPSDLHRLGSIGFIIEGDSQGNGPQQYPPRVFDCIWISDDSIVTSVTFDNEHSLGNVIKEALRKMYHDARYVRAIIVGQREWDQLRDLINFPMTPSKGVAPEPSFKGVHLMRLQHRDTCLAFEHAPMSEKTSSGN